jgi:hypothetical protein
LDGRFLEIYLREGRPGPVPVTPSEKTERPEGAAFDVEKGVDLRGMR